MVSAVSAVSRMREHKRKGVNEWKVEVKLLGYSLCGVE